VRGFLDSKRGKALDYCYVKIIPILPSLPTLDISLLLVVMVKIGGDTGKGFLKVTASIFTSTTEPPVSRKRRRTREEGISGGKKFLENGQRMILLLCVVKDVPESMENLELLFTYVNLAGLKFTITGNFKILMPWFGLLGCSSVHPCLYCNMERRKGEWIESGRVELRTLGGTFL
jgi:hypothetical protein